MAEFESELDLELEEALLDTGTGLDASPQELPDTPVEFPTGKTGLCSLVVQG